MPATNLDLSVVIVSFNTRGCLEETLAAVLADIGTLRAEVILVDNASDDGSVEAVHARFPGVHVIANDTNRLFTAASNQGLAVARGRYVLVLNSDAVPGPGTLPAFVTALDARPEVGIASCRLVWPDGRIQRNGARAWTLASLVAEHALVGRLLRRWAARQRDERTYGAWDRESERDIDVLPGSVLCVRREVSQAVGGFDERLRLYFGEDEWCARIQGAGHAVRYLPIGRVVHPEGTSTVRVAALARRLYFDDMIRFAGMRFGRARALCLRLLVAPTRLAHTVAARRRQG